MSEGPANNESKDYTNPFDNSDLVLSQKSRDLAPGFSQDSEIRAYKHYLETLQLEAQIQKDKLFLDVDVGLKKADGTPDLRKIELTKLIPSSQFENKRRYVIAKLTGMKEPEIKKLYSEFETDSLWTLSSKITNHIIGKDRRDKVSKEFEIK